MSNNFSPSTSHISDLITNFFSGSVSGSLTVVFAEFIVSFLNLILAAWVLQPFDVIKTTQQKLRIQSAGVGIVSNLVDPKLSLSNPSVYRTATYLVKNEGIRSLWKGWDATIFRVFFGAGFYFSLLHEFKHAFSESSAPSLNTATKDFVAAVAARSFSVVLLSPVSVVKTRIESVNRLNSPYKNFLHAIGVVYKSEGLASLYSGVLPTIVRDAPFSGIYYAFYSYLKPFTTKNEIFTSILPLPAAQSFVTGFIAGFVASLLTHPADVLKTQLQLKDARGVFVSSGVLFKEASALLRSSGLSAFGVGLGARVWKRCLSTSLTWTLFEELARLLSN